ncbi:Maf1 regulator-domain-containing protein [Scheffersomyces coipomensis]|uniref:Maf1 regulator-domain-containing protein n=1 Tax=Scheffersomyces coipomensis TaxID=1788519 RepID=UPI00315DD50F
MKFIDEIDIELVNQELNFNSQDNSLVIKGGCDLFTTKPIGSDRKLFKTIDKHLDQIIEDNQLSRSIEWERKNSIHSLFGSSASPPASFINRRDSYSTITERDRRQSSTSSSSTTNFSKSGNISIITTAPSNDTNINNTNDNGNGTATSLLTNSLKGETSFELEGPIDESPFGPLKNVTTRKTFAYLIAILNTTFPDHDFSNLQPTTENFHRIHNPEDLINRFNNIMISLGKKEDILNWIWDTINVYMDVSSPIKNSPSLSAQSGGPILSNSRKNSFNNNNNNNNNGSSHPYSRSGSTTSNNGNNSPPIAFNPELCQIYQFQPSDESILEDLNYPYQTMWSYYWFIYNKKKKRVAFVYLTAINQIHYSTINSSNGNGIHNGNRNSDKEIIRHEDDDDDIDVVYDDDDDSRYLDEDAILDDDEEDNDVIGDIEI